MDIVIPDTINGALLLSIIDFFLSFVVISFIGFVLAMLPLLNRLGPGIAAKIQHQLPPASARRPAGLSGELAGPQGQTQHPAIGHCRGGQRIWLLLWGAPQLRPFAGSQNDSGRS